MKNKKVIVLIAHDNKKPDIVNWAIKNNLVKRIPAVRIFISLAEYGTML